MYGRSVGGQTFTWEASGGLLNAGLVMRDRETDSWWSIITNDAIWGEARGTALPHLPEAEKTTFGSWRRRHPETQVLSVDGLEHATETPYDKYFASDSGFRDLAAVDDRLPDKALLFGLHLEERAHAVPWTAFPGGALVEVEGSELFLYREEDDSHYRSSVAVEVVGGAELRAEEGAWRIAHPDGRAAIFVPASRRFEGATELVRTVDGFDTYWYIWSRTNPDTAVHGD